MIDKIELENLKRHFLKQKNLSKQIELDNLFNDFISFAEQNQGKFMDTIGAVIVTRNDNYGGDAVFKLYYSLCALLNSIDELYLIDWNSPNDISMFENLKYILPKTGKLHHIQITNEMHREFLKDAINTTPVIEVLGRNIGLRRLSTDYKISTNQDILCHTRDSITNGIINENTFHVVARRHMDFYHAIGCQSTPGTNPFMAEMDKKGSMFGQHQDGSPLPGDSWSLISHCGDFQIAHTKIWDKIKGFEENFIYPGYNDSNVQKKAQLAGFNLQLIRNIPIFHFTHYPDTGSSGGAIPGIPWNDLNETLLNFTETTNNDNWGFSDINFKEDVL